MKLKVFLSSLALVAILLIILPGCSTRGDSPTYPSGEMGLSVNVPDDTGNHSLWGIWDIYYDINRATIEVVSNRNFEAHYNVTDLLLPPECPDCVTIKINFFDPESRILNIDVSLYNPSELTPRNVRGIIYTDEVGHLLTNPDDWTPLFDIPGGRDINPFRAFRTNQDHRKFPSHKFGKKVYEIFIPPGNVFGNIQFAIEGSWPGNCKEPHSISLDKYDIIKASDPPGTSYSMFARARDHQGDLQAMTVYCPEIFGPAGIPFENVGGYFPYEVTFPNSEGAPGGEYEAIIEAKSTGSEVSLYDIYTLVIYDSGLPTEVEFIDTPVLVQRMTDVVVTPDGFAVITSATHGFIDLHIYDLTDPENPAWLGMLEDLAAYEAGLVIDLAVSGQIAYVTSPDRLSFIDFSVPQSPELVHSIPITTTEYEPNLVVKDGYAYICSSNELEIVDIDPILSASVVNTIPISAYDIAIEGDLAYILGPEELHIVDISTPPAATVVHTFQANEPLRGIAVNNGYAYTGNNKTSYYYESFIVLDVDPPESAHVVATVEGMKSASNFAVSENTLLVNGGDGMYVYDITDPSSPVFSFVEEVRFGDFDLTTNYAYLLSGGLRVYQYKPADEEGFVGGFRSIYSLDKAVIDENYIFGLDSNICCVIDISSPEDAMLVSRTPEGQLIITRSMTLRNGLLYSGIYWSSDFGPIKYGFRISDITQSTGPEELSFLQTERYVKEVAVQGDYAYLAQDYVGLMIVNISDPANPFTVSTISPGETYLDEIVVDGEIAYVWGGVGFTNPHKLYAIDISAPDDPHLLGSVEIDSNIEGGLFKNGDYIVFTDSVLYERTIKMIDVSLPENPFLAESLMLPYGAEVKAVQEGIALIVASDRLYIVDVSSPELLEIITAYDSLVDESELLLQDNYIYIYGEYEPFQIYKFL